MGRTLKDNPSKKAKLRLSTKRRKPGPKKRRKAKEAPHRMEGNPTINTGNAEDVAKVNAGDGSGERGGREEENIQQNLRPLSSLSGFNNGDAITRSTHPIQQNSAVNDLSHRSSENL